MPGSKRSTEATARLAARLAALEEENQRLRRTARQAQAAIEAKATFLAKISHEIRTPLNGIIGLTELLLATDLDDRQYKYARLSLESARNLLHLFDSILDLQRLELDEFTLYPVDTDLFELVKEVEGLFRPLVERKGLDFVVEASGPLFRRYLVDPQRLRQILVNMLSNSLKYTEKGCIQVRVKGRASERPEDRRQEVRFEVEDTGIGLDEQEQAALFRLFSRGGHHQGAAQESIGLGLAISRELVHLMGGEIGVVSRKGEGACFWFQLPLEVRDQDLMLRPHRRIRFLVGAEGMVAGDRYLPADTEPGGPGRVLVVDDEATNRIVLQEICRGLGVETSCAANGREAVAMARRHDYALVLMDCQMPLMDGFAAARTIVEECEQQQAKAPVIVALTADATEENRHRCLEAGMVDRLVKPFDPAQIRALLGRWLPGMAPTPDEQSALPVQEAAAIFQPDRLDAYRQSGADVHLIVSTFVQALPGKIEALQEALQRGEVDLARRLAHTLKGSCSQMGAMALAELTREVEHRLAQGEELDAAHWCRTLEDTAGQTLLALAQYDHAG